MMNCVLTHASTVTRCATTARRVRSTSNFAASTVGHPSTPGREVRRPQAEAEGGRHGTEEDVVGGERAGLGRQLVEVEPSVLGVQDALGQPRRARSRVDHEQVVGTQRPPGQEAGHRGRGGGLHRGSVDEDR